MPRSVIVLYYYYFYEILISVRYSIFLLDLRMTYYGRGFELSGRINVNSVHIIVREICETCIMLQMTEKRIVASLSLG